MVYYKKEDLKEIKIENYADAILELLIKKYGIKNIKDIDNDEIDFTFFNADVFRQGACQLFAYKLNEIHHYKVYVVVGSEHSFHIFCKSDDGKEYIDVRGKTPSFREFVDGSELTGVIIDDSVEYQFISSDFNQDFHDVGLIFAEKIIRDDWDRYAP